MQLTEKQQAMLNGEQGETMAIPTGTWGWITSFLWRKKT